MLAFIENWKKIVDKTYIDCFCSSWNCIDFSVCDVCIEVVLEQFFYKHRKRNLCLLIIGGEINFDKGKFVKILVFAK